MEKYSVLGEALLPHDNGQDDMFPDGRPVQRIQRIGCRLRMQFHAIFQDDCAIIDPSQILVELFLLAQKPRLAPVRLGRTDGLFVQIHWRGHEMINEKRVAQSL